MAKETKKVATSKRTPHTRGTGKKERGEAKIRASEKLAATPRRDKYYGEGAIYGLRTQGAELLGEHYSKTHKRTSAKASLPRSEKVKSPKAQTAAAKKAKKG